MRYFEIYVAGRNGFSVAVKTSKPLTPDLDEELLNLAVKAKVIEGDDAKDVMMKFLTGQLFTKYEIA